MSSPSFIRKILVENLHGPLSYDLSPEIDEASVSPVLLLYGDNGSGKTSIAQLLFHLLSGEDNRGHRSFLARTTFKRFGVQSQTGSTIFAERTGSDLVGPYKIVSTNADGQRFQVNVKVSEDGKVKGRDVDSSKLAEVLGAFSSPSVSAYFLSDNRVLQSDEFDEEEGDEWISHSGRLITRQRGDSIEQLVVSSRTRSLAVKPSIWRADTWMRRQAISASNLGEESISTIYTDIIRRVSQSHEEQSSSQSFPELMKSLYELAERSESYADLGMIPKVPMQSLGEMLGSADSKRQQLLANILEPYVNSIGARLEALNDMQRRLRVFLDIINAFYRRKSVRITIRDGIDVFTEDGEALDPDLLSSGEKQLMLLLCNVLVATNQPTIFIIDEPELSLNVKWQRKLINSLLRLVEGSPVQFVMATHSIELLTQHKKSVLNLNMRGNKKGVDRDAAS